MARFGLGDFKRFFGLVFNLFNNLDPIWRRFHLSPNHFELVANSPRLLEVVVAALAPYMQIRAFHREAFPAPGLNGYDGFAFIDHPGYTLTFRELQDRLAVLGYSLFEPSELHPQMFLRFQKVRHKVEKLGFLFPADGSGACTVGWMEDGALYYPEMDPIKDNQPLCLNLIFSPHRALVVLFRNEKKDPAARS